MSFIASFKVLFISFILSVNFKSSIDDILGFSDALNLKDDILLEINIIINIYDYLCTLYGTINKNKIWNLRILDLDQDFIKDEKLNVAEYIETYGDVAVVDFKRVALG